MKKSSMGLGLCAWVLCAWGCSDTTTPANDGGRDATDVLAMDVPALPDGASDGGVCALPDGGTLPVGRTFPWPCAGSSAMTYCECQAGGTIHCDPGCPMIDASTADTADATAGVCRLDDGGVCADGSTCVISMCPDGVTPVSCVCRAGMLTFCTGGCPPVADAGH